jgi:hypothetical protein
VSPLELQDLARDAPAGNVGELHGWTDCLRQVSADVVSGVVQYDSTTASRGSNLRLRWEYAPGSELLFVCTNDFDTLSHPPSTGLRNRARRRRGESAVSTMTGFDKRWPIRPISTSYVDRTCQSADTYHSMIHGDWFETRVAPPLAAAVSSLRQWTLDVDLLLSILLLNLRGLLLADNLTAG